MISSFMTELDKSGFIDGLYKGTSEFRQVGTVRCRRHSRVVAALHVGSGINAHPEADRGAKPGERCLTLTLGSMIQLLRALLRGDVVLKDEKKGIQLIRRAAMQGHAGALQFLNSQ